MLYGVDAEFTVDKVSMGFATVNGVRISQRFLQRELVTPHTYARSIKAHSEYLRLSGLEQRKPTPWKVLEKRPKSHLKKWLKYKKTQEKYDFIQFIRAICPRVHVDLRLCIWFKDQPKRQLDDVVHLHGIRELKGKVVGFGHKGWYLVSCPLGVLRCHRSTLWCKGY